MTISATYIGQSTVQVSTTYTAGDSYTTLTPFLTIAKTIADAITGTQPGSSGTLSGTSFTAAAGITAQSLSGWTLLDSYWGNATQGYNSTGTGNYNYTDTNRARMYTQVFRSLNEDTASYKNIILEYDLKKSEINTYTCEYWDTSAVYNSATPTISANRAPTNLAYTYQNCCPINWTNDSCDMLIFVSPRWCLLHTYICNEPGNWAGVVELQREDPTDTATRGIPNWGWVNSVSPSTTDANGDINNSSAFTALISLPRTINGGVGWLSAYGWSADYGMITYPNRAHGVTSPIHYLLGSAINYWVANAWDQTRKLIMSIKPIHIYNPVTGSWYNSQENHGIMNGLKILAPVGANMQKIKVPVDSNGNSSRTGTDRSHWLLNINAKQLMNGTTQYGRWVANPKVTKTDLTTNVGGVLFGVMTGIWFYFFDYNLNQLKKLNTITQTVVILTNWSTTWSSVSQMKYDNERFIWVSAQNASATVVCWDITSDTALVVPSSTFTGSQCYNLEIGGSHVIAAIYLGNVNYSYATITRPDPTAALPASLTVTSNTIASIWLESGTQAREMIIDNYETIYTVGSIATAANARIHRMRFTPGTTTITYSETFVPASTAVNHYCGMYVIDTKTVFYNYQAQVGTANYAQYYSPSRDTALVGANTLNTTTTGAGATASAYTRLTYLKCQGTLLISPNLNNSSTAQVLSHYGFIGNSSNTGVYSTTPTADLAGANFFNAGVAYQAKWFDGSRLIVGISSGVRIYGNFNGGTSAGGIGGLTTFASLGQYAIPA